jgi:hypothetical protein
MKHLFYGSSDTDPKLIYESENGLDIMFSKGGAYGKGIYLANNSAYSSNYAYPINNGKRQIFLALVLVGDSVELLRD